MPQVTKEQKYNGRQQKDPCGVAHSEATTWVLPEGVEACLGFGTGSLILIPVGFLPTVFLTLEGAWVEVALRLPACLVDGLALELLEVVPAKTVPGA
jgi:hypothetical protein